VNSAISVSSWLMLNCLVVVIAAASMWLPGITIVVISAQVY